MTYDPKIHHRKSIRLQGYDYSKPGSYFVTICTESRGNELGKINDVQMFLNSTGEMINRWINELENKFEDLKLDNHIVMPSHIHFIVTTKPIGEGVGADLNIRPERKNKQTNSELNIARTEIRSIYSLEFNNDSHAQGGYINPPLQPANNICTSLSKIVQWFKIMTTDEYIKNVKLNNWKRFNKRFWQRSFYDHIIRNDNSYEKIFNYIKNNPSNWLQDIENKQFCKMITEKQREEHYKKLLFLKKIANPYNYNRT